MISITNVNTNISINAETVDGVDWLYAAAANYVVLSAGSCVTFRSCMSTTLDRRR